MLGLNRLRLAAMKEGVLSPVGGANRGFGHMVDDERQRRKLSNKVQLKRRYSLKISIKAGLLWAPIEAVPDLKGLCGGAAWLRPHSRDLRIHRPPGFCLHHSSVCRIDDNADDGRPELLRWIEDDECPETSNLVNIKEPETQLILTFQSLSQHSVQHFALVVPK